MENKDIQEYNHDDKRMTILLVYTIIHEIEEYYQMLGHGTMNKFWGHSLICLWSQKWGWGLDPVPSIYSKWLLDGQDEKHRELLKIAANPLKNKK